MSFWEIVSFYIVASLFCLWIMGILMMTAPPEDEIWSDGEPDPYHGREDAPR